MCSHTRSLRFKPAIDPVVKDLCKAQNICLGHLGPVVQREVTCLRFLAKKVRESFTFKHFIQIYCPKIYIGQMITLASGGTRICLANTEDDFDRKWYDNDLPFLEKWNFKSTLTSVTGALPNIEEWVVNILKQITMYVKYGKRSLSLKDESQKIMARGRRYHRPRLRSQILRSHRILSNSQP